MTRILICDDEEAILRFLGGVLGRAGYEVLEVHDGREALQVLQSQPCDLVLTDIFMEGQEGIETIRSLRQRWPALTIIAMSGGGSQGDTDVLTDARTFGADDILPKPFSPADLLRVVAVRRVEDVSMMGSSGSSRTTGWARSAGLGFLPKDKNL
ncbi:MAG: response regulator [Nitrospirales bacterium]|nr:response regulator [Nitrospirales bacterium]